MDAIWSSVYPSRQSICLLKGFNNNKILDDVLR